MKQITRPSFLCFARFLRQRVFHSVFVLSHAAQGYIMQLVTPSVVPIAVRIVTSVWIMVFQIVFLSISLIDN